MPDGGKRPVRQRLGSCQTGSKGLQRVNGSLANEKAAFLHGRMGGDAVFTLPGAVRRLFSGWFGENDENYVKSSGRLFTSAGWCGKIKQYGQGNRAASRYIDRPGASPRKLL